MKILLLSAALNSGGVETGTVDLSKSLKDLGQEVIVVSSGGKLVQELEKYNIRHIQLPVHRKSLLAFLQIHNIVKIIRKENIDIVHAQSRMPAWICYFACKITNTDFVTSCHGYYSRHLFSRVMGFGKRVIVVSDIIGKHMADKFGVSQNRVRLVYRGVDLSRYSFQPDKYLKTKDTLRIVNIARITPIKGQEDFIKAIGMVAKQKPNIEAWIVGGVDKGKGHYANKLYSLVNELGLQDKVKFLGERKDIVEILRSCDMLVLSTRVPEAFGRVIIEAGAVGVAVCAPDIGGINEVVSDKKDGVLFSCGNVNSMAKAILELANNTNLMQEYSVSLRRKIEEKFSLVKMAEETLSVYKEVQEANNILEIKLGGLGDLVLATPSLRMLRRQFPKARVSLLIDERFGSIMKNCPYVDELILFDRKKKSLGRIVSELKQRNFDVSIDFKNNDFTHILTYLSKIPKRYGFSRDLAGFLLNYPQRLSKDLAEEPVKQQFRILSELGVNSFDDRLELWTASEGDSVMDKLLEEKSISRQDKVIGLSLSASPEWPTKNWPIENFYKLSRLLSQRGFKVVLLGSDYSHKKIEEFTKDKNIIDLIGKTDLNQLVSLIKRLNVLVTGDSAPLHIASAVDTKIVALFGPTDPKRHVPPAKAIEVLVKRLDCQPCYERKCTSKDNMACLNKISAEEVLGKISQMI